MTEVMQETAKFSQEKMLKVENQKALKEKMEAILKPILQIE